MNAKELIIGHFEGSLTPAEQGRLDHMLETSPEVRAQFDQQKMIEESLADDSRSLIPPIGLREATIAAALGGGIATIGGGLGAWFTGKVAAMLGTVLVGGLVVGGILIYNGDDEAVDSTIPAVQVEESGTEAVSGSGSDIQPQLESSSVTTEEPSVLSRSSQSDLNSTEVSTTSDEREQEFDERSSSTSSTEDDYDPFGDHTTAEIESDTAVAPTDAQGVSSE